MSDKLMHSICEIFGVGNVFINVLPVAQLFSFFMKKKKKKVEEKTHLHFFFFPAAGP